MVENGAGLHIHLTYRDWQDYRKIAAEAFKTQDFTKYFTFLVERRIIKSWNFTDIDGKALDPTKVEDYTLLEMADFNRLTMTITNRISGASESAKN